MTVTADNLPALVDICRQLDGIPLAIELAAGRLALLEPYELARRLGDALPMLGRGPRDAPARHRTLASTLDWSYDLLDRDERDAFTFTALGAFVGGCDIAAAEAVTAKPLPVLEALADKSLIAASSGRLTLLEPVRQYAVQRLTTRPDAETVRERHFAHFLALAESSRQDLLVRGHASPLFGSVRQERDNFRAALAWSLHNGHAADTVALVGALGHYWDLANANQEGRNWCRQALAAAGDQASPRMLARARATWAARVWEDASERVRQAEAALELYRQLNDDAGVAECLLWLSNVRSFEANYDAARSLAEQALRHARVVSHPMLVGWALNEIAESTPQIELALPFHDEAVRVMRSVGGIEWIAIWRSSIGFAALREEAYDQADRLLAHALEAALAGENPFQLAHTYGNQGLAALLRYRVDAARTAFHDSSRSPTPTRSRPSTSRPCLVWPRSPHTRATRPAPPRSRPRLGSTTTGR